MKKVNNNIYKEIRPSYSLSAFLFTPLHIIGPLRRSYGFITCSQERLRGKLLYPWFLQTDSLFSFIAAREEFPVLHHPICLQELITQEIQEIQCQLATHPRYQNKHLSPLVRRCGGGRGNGGFQNEVCVVTKIRKT